MWQAVIFTLIAAAGNNIGKVLQKQGTKGLPRLSLNFQVMRTYILSPTWATGFCLDILGALSMLKAVSQAPVSVVQPVSGCGLAVLAVFSHFYLHEAMNPLDWLGVAMAGAGTIGVGMIGEEQKISDLHFTRLVWFILWAAFLFGSLDWWVRVQKRNRRAQDYAGSLTISSSASHSDVMEEVVTGMESGACFGMAAVLSRMGFMLSERGYSKLFVPAGIVAGVCCSGSGFFCQTRGLKDGRAVVVSTCAAVASIVTGVLVGISALGETLPVSPLGRTLLLVGWFLIILGVVILMDSTRISLMLPRSLRRFMKIKASQHRNFNPPRLGSLSRRESNPSTIVPLIAQSKVSPAKLRP